jgi:GT2 family glycosyltransferase
VTFVVPTLDRPAALELFLASADAQRCDRYEVVVIDQGDVSVESVVAPHRHTRFFRSEIRGLSHCRNIGIGQAAGELLVFADDDCVLSKDYLETLSSCASHVREPLTFGFGNAVNIEDDKPFVPTFTPGRGVASAWNCDTLCSISLVLNRRTLDRVGVFDEMFGVGAAFPACEETDLVLRVLAAGGRGVYLDRLTIRHPRRSRTPELVSRYESFGFAQGCLARKHAGNRVFLARFGYGILRSFGGLLLAAAQRSPLTPVYRAALRGKASGFRMFPSRRCTLSRA